jgi:hypothetical protein
MKQKNVKTKSGPEENTVLIFQPRKYYPISDET